MAKKKVGTQHCFLCPSPPAPGEQHAEGCPARQDVEIMFPDAPHTRKGQEAARRAWRRRMRAAAERMRQDAYANGQGDRWRRIELAVRATCGKATDDEIRELERLNEINA